ncbi:hypothetical protein ACFLU4_03650 [Chloroflexota bacterium]
MASPKSWQRHEKRTAKNTEDGMWVDQDNLITYVGMFRVKSS